MSYADLVEGDRERGLVGHTGIGAALGDDLAGGGQRQLGEGGAYQLIHQHREEHDVAHHVAVGKLSGLGCHAQRHASLRQQGDAEVLLDVVAAVGGPAADEGAGNFAQRAEGDVHHADEEHQRVGEDVQIQLCTAEHEEEDVHRRHPAVEAVHQLIGSGADVCLTKTKRRILMKENPEKYLKVQLKAKMH